MQYFLFTVSTESWKEHFATGIAAINDPGVDPGSTHGNAKRQSAMCELAGIRKGDCLFFYLQQEKKIMGLYEVHSDAFFDTRNLISGKRCFINKKFAIRVEFVQKINFVNNLDMDEVWRIKDKGSFWSVQQQRGDVVGRHACIALTRQDGEHLLKMLYQKNPIIPSNSKIKIGKHSRKALKFDLTHYGTQLHYEASLQGLLLNDLKQGKHKDIFGDYNYFVPFMPTSSQKEIDILLIKHNNGNEIIWYQVLELKQSTFSIDELDKLMNYENWTINALANNNERLVHSVGIAHDFDQDAIDYISNRQRYGGKKIRLIKYSYKTKRNELTFEHIN